MTGETILVIDAGEEIDQRITDTLEAESYLVYPVSSQGVNAELAELLRPSLIYIKPLEPSPTGLHPCKTIHTIPLLKKVPIVILASPKKALSPDTSRDYGIVDFLVPTFSSEELIQKTGTILGKAAPSRSPEEGEPAPASQTVREMEKKRPAFLLPAIGFVILLMIVGSGFLAYRQFMPPQKVSPSPMIANSSRVPSTSPAVGPKAQLPPGEKLANTSAPAPSAPSTPPEQPSSLSSESTSQPPRAPFYSVQLGAFKNEARAQALAKQFREKGYDAFTRVGAMKDSSPIYRVLVSKVEERNAAKKLAEEIQSREEVQTTLYGE